MQRRKQRWGKCSCAGVTLLEYCPESLASLKVKDFLEKEVQLVQQGLVPS